MGFDQGISVQYVHRKLYKISMGKTRNQLLNEIGYGEGIFI